MKRHNIITASLAALCTASAFLGVCIDTGKPVEPEKPYTLVIAKSQAQPKAAVIPAKDASAAGQTATETDDFFVNYLPLPQRDFAKPYMEEELEMLALVIYQEAGSNSCSDETRMMVGQVVLNRVADSRFPDNIADVLTQKSQYGRLHWTGLVWPERASRDTETEAVERAYKCAERVLEGEKLLPDDVVWQAEFAQGKEIVANQDGFYFCR